MHAQMQMLWLLETELSAHAHKYITHKVCMAHEHPEVNQSHGVKYMAYTCMYPSIPTRTYTSMHTHTHTHTHTHAYSDS